MHVQTERLLAHVAIWGEKEFKKNLSIVFEKSYLSNPWSSDTKSVAATESCLWTKVTPSFRQSASCSRVNDFMEGQPDVYMDKKCRQSNESGLEISFSKGERMTLLQAGCVLQVYRWRTPYVPGKVFEQWLLLWSEASNFSKWLQEMLIPYPTCQCCACKNVQLNLVYLFSLYVTWPIYIILYRLHR